MQANVTINGIDSKINRSQTCFINLIQQVLVYTRMKPSIEG